MALPNGVLTGCELVSTRKASVTVSPVLILRKRLHPVINKTKPSFIFTIPKLCFDLTPSSTFYPLKHILQLES